MVVRIKLSNSKPTPVAFRGNGFFILIPGNAVDLYANIPHENAQANVRNIQLEHPNITASIITVTEGVPTNDIVYISPDYLDDENYQGVWDASSGADPHGSPEAGWYWRVIVDGGHPLDGIFTWKAGDHVKWNGVMWMKIVTWPEAGAHNNLALIQGGTSGERFHLTQAQYDMIAAQRQTLSPESSPEFHGLTVEAFTLDSGVLPDGTPHLIKVRRGQTEEVLAYTPTAGEPVFDLEKKELRVGDGVTAGGHIIGQAVSLETKTLSPGTTVVDQISDTDARGAAWSYTIDQDNGANMRTGKIQACWNRLEDGAVSIIPEKVSPDIGTTLGIVSFSVVKTGHDAQLQCNVASGFGWIVDIVRMAIG